ncbi:MAG: hypothetical protein HYY01_05065 [Chloroflexi bacterium]|nr:hypothetical protein [Chloroflexota bacterium]
MAPWPWPLAPVLLTLLVSAGALLVYLVDKHVVRGGEAMATNGPVEVPSESGVEETQLLPRRLSILAGFTREILPVLILLWAGLIVAYLVSQRDYLWTILPWATVTTIMLWPVGRRLKRSYFSYRSIGFVIGVISMAYIPFAGFGLMAEGLSFGVKSAIFFGLVIDLTALGILPGLRWFIGRPMGMFFRPDLLFGDGRVLATGTLALVLGLRYIIGSPAMGVTWPLPKWDWYAIFFAMVVGLIPLIALRGMTKVLMRMRRMRDVKWNGWGAVIIREGLLVVTVLSIGYGFHNAFMGTRPFADPILTSDRDFGPALGIVLGAAAFLILVRGGYKKAIGDPFIVETIVQSFIKQVLLVIGVVGLMYGFMSILSMSPMPTKMGINGLRTWSNSAKIWEVGIPIVAWGLIMLIPIRVWIQHYQRHAIVAQMAAVIVPNQRPEHRRWLLTVMMAALQDMPTERRVSYLTTMNAALATADAGARAAVTEGMVSRLVELPPGQRNVMMEAQAAALGKLKPEHRVMRMADMMGAVSNLPEENRRLIMEKIASMLV